MLKDQINKLFEADDSWKKTLIILKNRIWKDAKVFTCPCGADDFKVKERYGGGGSGTYIKLICSKCSKTQELDFDNPNYEG